MDSTSVRDFIWCKESQAVFFPSKTIAKQRKSISRRGKINSESFNFSRSYTANVDHQFGW